MISTSPIRISCVVQGDRVPDAVRALHSAFELAGADTDPSRATLRRVRMSSGLRIAVVGATGAGRRRPAGPAASSARSGRRPDRRGRRRSPPSARPGDELDDGLVVQPLTEETSRASTSRCSAPADRPPGEWAPRFAAGGAVVIDNSSAWRDARRRPARRLRGQPRGAATATAASSPTRTARRCRWSSRSSRCRTRPASSGWWSRTLPGRVGHRARRRSTSCSAQAHAVLHGEDVPARGDLRRTRSRSTRCRTPAPSPPGDDHTDEERKLINETRKILGDQSIRVSPTCVRVPVVNGHSEAVDRRDARAPERRARPRAARGRARARRRRRPGGRRLPDGHRRRRPGRVFVGRIRRDPGHERGLALLVVADNLRKGAALNAVQLAELVVEQELLGAHRRRACRRGLTRAEPGRRRRRRIARAMRARAISGQARPMTTARRSAAAAGRREQSRPARLRRPTAPAARWGRMRGDDPGGHDPHDDHLARLQRRLKRRCSRSRPRGQARDRRATAPRGAGDPQGCSPVGRRRRSCAPSARRARAGRVATARPRRRLAERLAEERLGHPAA